MNPEAFLVYPLAAMAALFFALRRTAPEHRRYVILAFCLHVVAAFALVAYHEFLYRGGDIFHYGTEGRALARLMRLDPVRYGPEVVRLALHWENDVADAVTLPGTPTATMTALTGCLMFVGGETLYGASLLVAFFSFYGSVRLYGAVESKLEPAERRPILLGTLFVPSALFWTSGLIKEAFVVGFLGVAAGAVSDVLRHRRVSALPSALGALWGIALIKPYVLVPFVLATAGWVYAGRGKNIRIGYRLLGLAIATGGVFALSTLFPDFAPSSIGAAVAREQRKYSFAEEGASNLEIGLDDREMGEGSIASHVKYLPLALLNALARPMVFDVHNAATLLAAIEMTYLLWLLVDMLRKYGLRRMIAEGGQRPHYVAMLWFILPFALSIGLTTRNLGSLSRYRVPAMPLMFGLLLGLRSWLAQTSSSRVATFAERFARTPGRGRSPTAVRARRGIRGARAASERIPKPAPRKATR